MRGTAIFFSFRIMPGLFARLIFVALYSTGSLGPYNWSWLTFCVLDDIAEGLSWIVFFNRPWIKILSIDVPFYDARLARIMVISVAVVLTASTSIKWQEAGGLCRFQVMIEPTLLVFALLPMLIDFDHEPGHSEEHHAAAHSNPLWTYLHKKISTYIPSLIVILAGQVHAAIYSSCHSDTKGKVAFEKWVLSGALTILLGLSSLKVVVHKNTGANPILHRDWRLLSRVLASAIILSITAAEISAASYVWCMIIVLTAQFCLERFGRLSRLTQSTDSEKQATELGRV